ncbi:PDZ domain-containing protein [Sulfuriroseicoccus oceanibius]|uniref:PDZ domain-containing protein n=1 Tax=Sulfuriroseicoccus oceanibius TaxID=2707525 RepID=A0A6B3L1M3_9BACT|nr:PDZ domain-containing protein [Sulfuriroseicoccus oceanibius]QQL44375.1 PDZ domain-containing protein [Sulfuriroseicoccus oceanibius]
MMGAGLLALATVVPVSANALLEVEDRTNGRETVKAFDTASEVSKKSTVTLHVERRPFALATVVEPGFAVTKASELKGKDGIYASNARRRKMEVEVVGIDDDNDLALLKLTGEHAEALEPATPVEGELPIGTVVVGSTPRIGWMRVALVSANPRSIETRGGTLAFLGEEVKDGKEPVGVKVTDMVPDGPMVKAGLKKDDVLVMVGDSPVTTLESLGKILSEHDPGDKVNVTVERGDEQLVVEAELASPSETLDKFDRNQQMSGRTSYRKSGFSQVIQTDLPLPPTAMGGAVLTLDGEALAVLIARADRVTTYALPMATVRASIDRIRTGGTNDDEE